MAQRNVNFNLLQIIKDKSERAILIICIGIAFIFWIGTKMAKSYDSAMEVKLDFIPPNAQNILTKKPPEKLKLTLHGNGWGLMFQSFRKTPRLAYRLSQDTLQEFRFQQFNQDLQPNIRGKVDIETIVPDKIALHLDAKVSKRIPIQFNQDITIAAQFLQIAPASIRPDTVVVTGPASVLKNINFGETKAVAFNNLTTRMTDLIAIRPYNNQQVVFEPNAVIYDVIIEQLTEKELEIPIEVIGQTDSLAIYPNRIKVKCTVGLSDYDRLQPTQLKLVVDAANLKTIKAPIILQQQPSFIQSVKYAVDSVSYLVFK